MWEFVSDIIYAIVLTGASFIALDYIFGTDKFKGVREALVTTHVQELVAGAVILIIGSLHMLAHLLESTTFKDLTTLLKYPILKVRGEVLGRVVLKARIDCHKEMAERVDYSILNTTLGKSVFMSNYIPVCEAARNSLVSQGFKPIEIYGEFTKDQDNRIRLFKTDPSIDPLVGTIKSISTAHHFAIADMILLGDTPFRTYMLDQAIARAWRTGQQNQVKIVYTRLKYNEDNINSRNIDILKWAKSMVEEITGTNISYLDFDKGRSVENIDLEDIDDLIVNEDINENNEENDMSRVTINDRLNKSNVIDNETGDITSPVDNEGMLSNMIDKVKNWFKKKEEVHTELW